MSQKLKWWVFFLAIIFLASGFAFNKVNPHLTTFQNKNQISSLAPIPTAIPILKKVVRVIDGDTIEIEGGERVRYIGMDAPELNIQDHCFGPEATRKNKELVEGKTVRLEKDISETDIYKRLLRYIFIDDVFVNDYLVRQGYAHVSTYPPDVKYENQFLQAEQEARENKRGLWSKDCDKEIQTSMPNTITTPTKTNSNSDCLIKGNISSSGEKIYHVPGQRYYEQTKIEENKGERWFCSEQEAQEAGWRKSKI